MSTPYYTHSSTPILGSLGSSSLMRAEFTAIETGFSLIPDYNGQAGKLLVVNSGATGLTFTTGTLALAGNFITTGAFTTTLVQSASVTLTLPGASGTLATIARSESFTNKTITSPVFSGTTAGTPTLGGTPTITAAPTIANAAFSGTVTGTYTFAGTPTISGGTVTLNSPTLTSPTFTNPSMSSSNESGDELVLTSGQIAFPASQNASAAANTLDDYEEGTWTPALSCNTVGNLSVSYTTQLGVYTKIGRQVHASFYILTSAMTHTTASGRLTISLPMAAASAAYYIKGTLMVSGDNLTTVSGMTCEIGTDGTSLISLCYLTDADNIAYMAVADHTSGGSAMTIYGTISYWV